MRSKKVVSLISILGAMFLLNVVFGNGCSPSGNSRKSNSSRTAIDENAIEIIPGTKMVATAYSKQILDQLSSCAGVATPSDASVKMYEEKRGAVSVYGSPDTMTGPMMMSVISIAGEVCNDLIDQEAKLTTKRIFTGWDLSSTSLPSDSQLKDSISKLALSCWDRAENSDERTDLLSLSTSVQHGEALASRKTALMLCTSVLSSLNSLLL